MTGCPVAHDYDPLDPAIVFDPYPLLNRLRGEAPVFYLPDLDHHIVTRLDDIEAILTDRETWSAANASSPLMPVCAAAQAVLDSGFKRVPTLNNADPPRHGPMRKSVQAVMTPRRLQALEPTLREYAQNLVVGFRDEAVVDFVERFAFPFPGYAAFSLLGFPDTDTEMLKEWSRTRVLLTYGQLSGAEQVATAGDVVRMWRYVEDFVARRHAEPVDDLTSDLVRLSRQARAAHGVRHRQHRVLDGAGRARDDDQHDQQRRARAPSERRPVAAPRRRPEPDPERGRRDPSVRRADPEPPPGRQGRHADRRHRHPGRFPDPDVLRVGRARTGALRRGRRRLPRRPIGSRAPPRVREGRALLPRRPARPAGDEDRPRAAHQR